MSTFMVIKLLAGTVVASAVISAIVNSWRFALSLIDRAHRKSNTD